MTTEAASKPTEIPAATLVVFRQPQEAPQPEILMVVRSREMSFAGGAAVFPGGRVDQADRDLATRLALSDDVEEIAHRIAAIRETLEETGLAIGLMGKIDANVATRARKRLLQLGELAPILDEFDLSLDIEALLPFARWLPRGLNGHRIFDTRFYLADLGTGAVDVEVDETENTHLFWTSAANALKLAEDGDIRVIFPTRRNLERIAQFGSFDDAREHTRAFPVRTITPFAEGEGDQRRLCIPDDLGYPVTSELFSSASRG